MYVNMNSGRISVAIQPGDVAQYLTRVDGVFGFEFREPGGTCIQVECPRVVVMKIGEAIANDSNLSDSNPFNKPA